MAKDITKTPVKLYPPTVRAITTTSKDYPESAKAMIARFKTWMEDHGLTFAVNQAMLEWAQSGGLKTGAIETPTARMAGAQHRRWRNTNRAKAEADQEAEAKREARREREKARKAEQLAGAPEQGTEGEIIDFT